MKLYAVWYGKDFKYGTRGSVYKDCQNPDEILDEFVFLYYIAEVGDTLIYIDTGFRDKALAEKMGITLFEVGHEIKQVFGGKRAKIVMLTHTHWDHVNNLDLYQDAEIIVSDLAYSTMLNYVNVSDKVKNMNWNKFTKVTKELDVENFFRFVVIGGHTPDSAIIKFQVGNKNYVITGDECYLCDNLTKELPVGSYVSSEKNKVFIHEMRKEGRIPFTFHDKSILENGKKITEHIIQVL
ncbi:MAG: MBL fold metallo-hydrolase [Lachnospiraceae bacterium]|nr:MBL fold metallo-hydrolase [Lachnospiraceae bacterium]